MQRHFEDKSTHQIEEVHQQHYENKIKSCKQHVLIDKSSYEHNNNNDDDNNRRKSQMSDCDIELIKIKQLQRVIQLTSDDNEFNNILVHIIHPENSDAEANHIMSDYIELEFDTLDIMIQRMQDGFANKLNIKLKNILEKYAQDNFDNTLISRTAPNSTTSDSKSSSRPSITSTTSRIVRTKSTIINRSTTSQMFLTPGRTTRS